MGICLIGGSILGQQSTLISHGVMRLCVMGAETNAERQIQVKAKTYIPWRIASRKDWGAWTAGWRLGGMGGWRA